MGYYPFYQGGRGQRKCCRLSPSETGTRYFSCGVTCNSYPIVHCMVCHNNWHYFYSYSIEVQNSLTKNFEIIVSYENMQAFPLACAYFLACCIWDISHLLLLVVVVLTSFYILYKTTHLKK